ncbi:uncharacterized protein C8R40DRAFT_1054680 [Lentinula edodes]|uniref:uncharacterized protein n=1 Tax=Lentinula edodes TaxID=5353 RepID=UPI001E8DF40C|nr:uncharacterized protein C8R40DRAFT_1054680 [Lentinula edodes]KAH7871431.1 hypothetical protein C8R40DRAFT_1054680 [Lentinula edodes]
MKQDGIVTDETRDISLDLVAIEEVPANKVTRVFKRIAAVFGIDIEGEVSRRTVSRITKEGGVASKLQIGQAVLDSSSKGVTISSDGTTHKNETYETKHATVIQADQKLQFFLGLKMAINHTSETQLGCWIETFEDIFHLLFESGMCSEDDARIFWNLVTGFHSDHAADQRKLFELLRRWKEKCDREVRGERAMKRLTDLEYACLIFQGSQTLVQQVGGPATWEALTTTECSRCLEAMRNQIIHDMGEAEYAKLSEAEKAEVDFFLWAGCCMHKEMNAFKGGCIGLDEFWKQHPELDPPKLLPNRDNAAAISKATGTEAADRALERSERGAIKVASLAGAIFRHKDGKRGQQDMLRFFFDHKLGFNISFPDTSNTRFQSHAEACAVIITYLDLFIEFLTYVKQNKGSGKLNHMEQNVFDGLQDIPTRHEFIAITLYWLAISVPYMREIRGPYATEDNVLKLGPLHQRVIDHIDTLIKHPEYLIGPNASAEMGSLDGRAWERPEAFYASQKYAPNLPHSKDVLIHFLKSARILWVRFSAELLPGGALANATPEQIESAWMEKTNDLNEADFGMYRQAARATPTISLAQYNARKMFKLNQTAEFLHSLSPEMRQWLRKITRTQDASGSSRQQRIQLAEYRQQVAEDKTQKQQERMERHRKAAREIDAISPIQTVTELDFRTSLAVGSSGYLTVPEITKQLKWHKIHGVKEAITTVESKWGNRTEKLKLLHSCIEKFVDARASIVLSEGPREEEEDPEVTVQDLNDFDSDGYDSEEDYYK